MENKLGTIYSYLFEKEKSFIIYNIDRFEHLKKEGLFFKVETGMITVKRTQANGVVEISNHKESEFDTINLNLYVEIIIESVLESKMIYSWVKC